MNGPIAAFATLTLIAPLAVHADDRPPTPREIYRLTDKGGGPLGSTDETAIFSLVGKRWIVEHQRQDSDACKESQAGVACMQNLTVHNWIDSDTCPQLAPALRALTGIRPPAFTDPDNPTNWWASDVPLLTIEGWPKVDWPKDPLHPVGSTAAKVSVSVYDGDYRNWWEATKKALQLCWKSEAPNVAGVPMKVRIAWK